MNGLLLHPRTRQQFDQFSKTGNHALLVIGLPGAGKESIVLAFAQQLLGGKPLDLQPYFKHITPDEKTVTIEQIRQLRSFVQLKTTGGNAIRRVVVISQADTMSDEAQNALLKLLEEPPTDTVLILSALDAGKMKQTILSRVQLLPVERVTLSDATDYFVGKYSAKDIAWAYALSDGQAGLMTALLAGKDDHTIARQIELAKQLLSLSVFERLAKVDEIAKSKDVLPDFLYSLKRICTSALESAAKKQSTQQVAAWHKRLSLVLDAELAAKTNVHSKLLLTDLFVHL